MSLEKDFFCLKRALFDKYFGFLNPAQREAVYTTEGPLLVLAGAGSGKTTVIVNRIANLVLFGRASSDKALPENAEALIPLMKLALADGSSAKIREALQKAAVEPVFPYRVLCITFTNKAAREFKERLEQTLGEAAHDIWAGTFHSICVRILRRHIDRLGYKSDFTIYDVDDCKRLITSILKELNIGEHTLAPKTALYSISAAKEKGLTPRDELLDAGRDRMRLNLARVYESYQEKLFAANALDFDDIIMLTNRLFESHPDVLDRYREQFRYLLVDEYQDTNPSQSRLVAQLAGERCNVCVVGDDDQSIYSFRGATVENILGFDREYRDTSVIRLEQNYRSTGNILKAANGIIAQNESRLGKELWTSAGDGERVHVRKLYSQAEEAAFICDTIASKVSQGAKYSDFAVLYRVNALSNSLETAFVKKRIPYRIFGGVRFYERREIKDVLAYLSVISNRSDSVRLRRIINLPKRAIGDATVEKIASIAEEQNVPMFSIIENAHDYSELKRVAPKLIQFAALINELRDFSAEASLADLVSRVIERTGYRVMLAEEDDGAEREENVLELVSSAALFAETSESPTLSEFLNEIALVSDLDGYDDNADSVALMTVHSAKGLEFPVVFIPGFEEGLFPITQSSTEGEKGIEEERRLAYVAVTRAKEELYLLNVSNRMLYGRTELKRISRFADEIPKDCCESGHASGFGAQKSSERNAYTAQNAESRSSYLKNVGYGRQASAGAVKTFRVGAAVSHPMFGVGEVLSAQPMGGDVLYEIEFESSGVKRLMGNFAKLKEV
ncbi:MAG: UvrD-helicase domain-containing protein [Clostridia bacterium]|nr:UvrD-helicase domain-containing protein [Clostridia bacterium]